MLNDDLDISQSLSIDRLVCSKLVGNGVQIAFKSGKIAIEISMNLYYGRCLWWQFARITIDGWKGFVLIAPRPNQSSRLKQE
jgi:hypothetical protein